MKFERGILGLVNNYHAKPSYFSVKKQYQFIKNLIKILLSDHVENVPVNRINQRPRVSY